MLTTISRAIKQLGYYDESEADKEEVERMIKGVSAAIETYCRRDFSEEFTLPEEEDESTEEKPRLPYDVEDACLLWLKHRDQMNASLGVQSERIDGLGQKNYSSQHVEGKFIPAPPAVLALIDPYREMIYK